MGLILGLNILDIIRCFGWPRPGNQKRRFVYLVSSFQSIQKNKKIIKHNMVTEFQLLLVTKLLSRSAYRKPIQYGKKLDATGSTV